MALVYFNPSTKKYVVSLKLVTYLVFAASFDDADSIPAPSVSFKENANRTKQMGNQFDEAILIEWIQKKWNDPTYQLSYAFICLMNHSRILSVPLAQMLAQTFFLAQPN